MNLKKAFLLAIIAVSAVLIGLVFYMGYSFVHSSFAYRAKMGRQVAARVYADLVRQTRDVREMFPHLLETSASRMKDNVRVLALMDGERCALPIRGDLPVSASFEDVDRLWEPRRFFGSQDHFLLVRRLSYRGEEYLMGILPDFSGQLPADITDDGFGLVLCDSQGRALWQNGTNPFFERGWVPSSFLSSSAGWHRAPWGEWIWGRIFPVPIGGLRLFVSYPLSRLLPGILRAVIVPAALAALLLVFFALLWFYLRKRVLDPLDRAGRVIRSLERHMETGAGDAPSRKLLALARNMESQSRRSSLGELREFGKAFSSSLKTLAQREAEVRTYSEKLDEMNERLNETKLEISRRDRIWKRTLATSQVITRDGAGDRLLNRFSEIFFECSEAFGVLIGIFKGDRVEPLLITGFGKDGVNWYSAPLDASLIGRALRTGRPVWWRLSNPDPEYCPLSEAVRSEVNIPLFHMGKAVGAISLCWDWEKDEDPLLLETLIPLAGYLAGTVDAELFKKDLRESYHYLVNRLQHVTAIYHEETAGHLARVEAYCRFLAEKLGRTPREVDEIGFFSRLHDIGKLRIPREILAKKGPLTPQEFEVIKKHTTWGAEVLGDAGWLAMGRRICLYHHEKWDGSGYPCGLAGREIPWEARIMALADVYDALRSRRCYKREQSHDFTVRVILEGDGRVMPGHFDPSVLTIFREHHEEMGRIYDSLLEAPEEQAVCVEN